MKTITDVLAAELTFDFDYSRIAEEILACQKFWINTPPYRTNLDKALNGTSFVAGDIDLYDKIDYIDNYQTPFKVVNRSLRAVDIFYLKEVPGEPVSRFDYTKKLDHKDWVWRADIKDYIPYTIKCIESLPFKDIGCIRTFIADNTIFPTHRDYGWDSPFVSDDYDKCLGISIIPSTGDVPMLIQDDNKQVHSVPGNAMIFNDSAWHGVPLTTGIRITIRIFGDANFEDFSKFLNKENAIYRTRT
jgi:hypothetical protein